MPKRRKFEFIQGRNGFRGGFFRTISATRPSLKVICFPFLGGDAQEFLPYLNYLEPGIELISVQFPGRSNLVDRAVYNSGDKLLDDLIKELAPQLIEQPFIVMGYSLGGVVAHVLCSRLYQEYNICPLANLVHSSSKGYLELFERMESDDEFMEQLKGTGLIPGNIMYRNDVLEKAKPILYADGLIGQELTSFSTNKIPCTLHCFYGNEDNTIRLEDLKAWNTFYDQVCYSSEEGGHFFFRDKMFIAATAGLINGFSRSGKNDQ